MSSTAGLEILKNWQRSETVMVVSSVSFKGRTELFEVRVKILSVDESTLVLSSMDSPGEIETVDIRGAEFAEAPGAGIELKLTTGKTLYMEEAKPED